MQLLPEGVTIEIADYKDVPLYNGDFDLPTVSERPASVTLFRDLCAKADGLVIVSPEYNYSIPGGLKNAIDWASRGQDSPSLNKPVAVMGATPGMWGTARMQLAFNQVFQFLNMHPVFKPEILVALAAQKFDENGHLKDDIAKELIRKKLQALKDLVIQMRGINNS